VFCVFHFLGGRVSVWLGLGFLRFWGYSYFGMGRSGFIIVRKSSSGGGEGRVREIQPQIRGSVSEIELILRSWPTITRRNKRFDARSIVLRYHKSCSLILPFHWVFLLATHIICCMTLVILHFFFLIWFIFPMHVLFLSHNFFEKRKQYALCLALHRREEMTGNMTIVCSNFFIYFLLLQTDTTSVSLEAIGYIRFLQSQIEVINVYSPLSTFANNHESQWIVLVAR